MEIEHKYVTPEQAKLLKKKNFNTKVYQYYREDNNRLIYLNVEESDGYVNNWEYCYSVPEQWQVVEWLLKKYNIHIQVYPLHDDKWEWCIMFLNEPLQTGFKSFMSQFCVDKSTFNSKEETYSSAFDYVLKQLI